MTATKNLTTFGTWIRTRRKQLDLTQFELGKRVGCSEAAIRKIEAEERKPSRQLAELLLQALEIPASEKETFFQFARGVASAKIHLAAKSTPNNLPALLTSTINRTNDLAAVAALLAEQATHLVTLIGPPGIGKTRLSIHCGNALLDAFADGVWFVDLAEINNPDFFISTLARSLPGLDLPPSPGLAQLLSGLKDKSLLLILDNFEHIVDKSALEVAQILRACPRIKILVTSRVPLHIYGEHEYHIPPLSIPPREAAKTPDVLLQFEAVQLFVARARQHQPKFTIAPENASAIIDICATLAGIPLALELAAATLRQMTLDEMASLLRGKDWGRQISTPARDLPLRQRTLENVIDWSYTLLTMEQQAIFCKLGVFSGWFDSDATGAVCEMNAFGALRISNLLTDHSLLECEIFNGKAYWRMLELIREYAQSRMEPAQRSRVELLRAEYFSQRLQALRHKESSKAERETFYRINLGNLLAALNWAIAEKRTDLGFQLVKFLDDAWTSYGYSKEILELVRQLMALPDESEPRLRVNRLQMASDLAWQQHDFETGLAYSKAALELGRAHGLIDTHLWHLNRLGRIYIEQEKFAEARVMLEECHTLVHENPDIMNPGLPLAQLGEIALFEGRLGEARFLLETALTHLVENDEIFLAMARTDLAEIALAERDFPTARGWLKMAYSPASQHIRRLLVFFYALAGYLVLSNWNAESGLKLAARFYGAIESLGEYSGVNFASFYRNLNQQRIQRIRKKMSAQIWQAEFDAGRLWSREYTLAQAEQILRME